MTSLTKLAMAGNVFYAKWHGGSAAMVRATEANLMLRESELRKLPESAARTQLARELEPRRFADLFGTQAIRY